MIPLGKSRLAFALLFGGAFFIVHAQDAATLKTRFSNFLGAGKYVKLVWQSQAGGLPGLGGEEYDNVNTTIKAMDSKDGVVRTLVGGSGFKHSPTFTWDGKRVIYYNNTSSSIHVIGFDGSAPRTVLSNAGGGGHCWRSGSTDYVLASLNDGLYRVNIDNTSDRTKLYNGETSWISMSVDGAFLAGGFPEVGSVGTYNISTGTKTIFKTNGCWPTIARDNTYNVLHTIEPHTDLRLVTHTGATIKETSLIPILEGRVYETLRWTPDRDYCTIALYDEEKVRGCQGVPGPKLVKISTVTAVAVSDNPSQSEGNMDAFFYIDNTNVAGGYIKRPLVNHAADAELFDFCGRVIRGGMTREKHGVQIRRHAGKAAIVEARICP